MKRKHAKPVLIDLDETVVGFVTTWNQWLKETKGEEIDEALYWHYDIDAYLYNFIDLQKSFLEDYHRLNPQPIPEALSSLQQIQEKHHVIALTARNKDEWANVTESWIGTHLPFVKDIHYTRSNGGAPSTPKGVIADKLNAYALIDDTSHWLETLPKHINGYLVKRPKPLASDLGAQTWDKITKDILKRR